MNLSDLTTQFTGLMNRRDLAANTTLVTNFINQGLMRIQRELRVPAMEKTVLVTLGSPYNGLVIPNDLIELISIIPQSSSVQKRIDKVDLTRAMGAALQNGTPEVYARQGGAWVLGPSPSPGDVIRIDY